MHYVHTGATTVRALPSPYWSAEEKRWRTAQGPTCPETPGQLWAFFKDWCTGRDPEEDVVKLAGFAGIKASAAAATLYRRNPQVYNSACFAYMGNGYDETYKLAYLDDKQLINRFNEVAQDFVHRCKCDRCW